MNEKAKKIADDLVMLVLLLLVIVVAVIFYREDGHIRINSESAKVFFIKGGFRSWGVFYSWGHQWQPDGTWKNLWTHPQFYHNDVRKLMNRVPKTGKK